jgi:hypothetical protein
VRAEVASFACTDVAAARRALEVDGAVILRGAVAPSRLAGVEADEEGGGAAEVLPRIQRLLVSNPQIPQPHKGLPPRLGGPKITRQNRQGKYVESSAGRWHMSLLQNEHHELAEEVQNPDDITAIMPHSSLR